MRSLTWLWWLFLIFLLLRVTDAESQIAARFRHRLKRFTDFLSGLLDGTPPNHLKFAGGTSGHPGARSLIEVKEKPQSPDDLGVPKCQSNADCVHGGACLRGPDGENRCLCSTSCPPTVPMECRGSNGVATCLSMGDDYRKKYWMQEPSCYRDVCVCPPMFEPFKSRGPDPDSPFYMTMLPTKCDKRELMVLGTVSPSDSVYKGTDVSLHCCINMDPRDLVASDGVDFIQNMTIIREPTSTPYESLGEGEDSAFGVSTCWSLAIKNVQQSDSGSYMCHVKPQANRRAVVNFTIEFLVKDGHLRVSSGVKRQKKPLSVAGVRVQLSPAGESPEAVASTMPEAMIELRPTVKSPRMIQNVSVKSNDTRAQVTWDTQEGPMLKIDLRLVRRTDGNEMLSVKNAKSGLIMEHLRPATPYTLFITVVDGQSEPFKLTEHFTTAENEPGPPNLDGIRLINSGDGLKCEVEWTPPKKPNGRIVKYFVAVRGVVRYSAPGGALAGEHLPSAEEPRCSNYLENNDNVNPLLFASDFFSCRYGPLKPNRNYTATLWAENNAGRSEAVSFTQHCLTDYAEPDVIEQPQLQLNHNSTAFNLRFTQEPDETNGPIACYYVAVVPLLSNVSIESLPPPDTLVMDTFSKALNSNLHWSAVANRRYFAYIAESYMQFPKETIIGDGNTTAGIEPCNVLYLSRHRPEDPALRPGLKYTGFLIVRVDRDETSRDELLRASDDGFLARRRRTPRHVREASRRGGSSRVAGQSRGHLKHFNAHDDRTRLSSFLGYPRNFGPYSSSRIPQRPQRQLHLSGPAYGFSGYFKPVYLEPPSGGVGQSWGAVLLIVLSLLVCMLMATSGLLYYLHKCVCDFCDPNVASCKFRKGVIKHWCPRKKQPERMLIKPGFQAIPAEDLPSEYVIRHRDSDFLFTAEFDALPHYNHFDCTASEKRENQRKNRYNDIKAFDVNRVKLQPLPGDPNSDYINASVIQGYKGRKTFIAAQGPLDNTIDDFWRLVWEQKVQLIVMVANLYEKCRAQCSKYWPDDEATVYGRIEVRPVDATYYADYSVRVFELRLVGGANSSMHTPNGHLSGSAAISNGSVHDANSLGVSRPGSEIGGGSMESDLNVPDYVNITRSASHRSSRSSRHLSGIHAETDFGGRSPDVRHVVQYHYINWSDYRAPECTTGLLRFINKLRQLESFNKSPVAIHCSAGVGRTGTFIAIDGVLDQCLEEGKADVFGFVSEMRKQRNFMVQSLEQYVFVYKALAEWYLFADTDVDVEQIRDHVDSLRDPPKGEKRPSTSSAGASSVQAMAAAVLRSPRLSRLTSSNSAVSPTGMELEFKKLERTLESSRSCDFARRDENLLKNRFEGAVPYDRNRVVLSPLVGHADASYINASTVKGYFYPYILAQDPVNLATCYDFWRMVGEQKSASIVMLSNEDDFSIDEKYWPDEVGKSMTFGRQPEITVQLVSEDPRNTCIIRRINYRKERESREVVQFAFTEWPSGAPVPPRTDAIVELIGRVLQRQSNQPEAGPIVLHCRDGSASCGVYCCVSLLLERLKAEHRVDVFQTVKSLQAQRPLLFTQLEQYAFCYEAVIDYLDSC